MFLDRQRRLRRRLSGEKNAAFGEAVRNYIDTPNREMVFCEKKTAKRSFSIMASLLFTVFLSAPPGRGAAPRGGGRTDAFAYDVQAAASKLLLLIRREQPLLLKHHFRSVTVPLAARPQLSARLIQGMPRFRAGATSWLRRRQKSPVYTTT